MTFVLFFSFILFFFKRASFMKRREYPQDTHIVFDTAFTSSMIPLEEAVR